MSSNKNLLILTILFGLIAFHGLLGSDRFIEELEKSDNFRIKATINADKNGLEKIFSNQLRYGHSSGKVDTKSEYIDLILSGRTKYVSFKYLERTFSLPAPDIATMTGKALVKAEANGTTSEVMLVFLALWKKEDGRWRFLAWQSCKI